MPQQSEAWLMASTMLALRDSRSWEAQKKQHREKKRRLVLRWGSGGKQTPPLKGQGQPENFISTGIRQGQVLPTSLSLRDGSASH